MKNGWTGGQYSMIRAIAGIALLVDFAMHIPEPLAILGAIAAVFFTIGLFDRVAAVMIAGAFVWNVAHGLHPAWLAVAAFLVLHALLPPAPYGSLAARGRVDPRGAWAKPSPLLHLLVFNPAWIRPRAEGTVDAVFYDGTCGLCHRSVRLLIAEDASGRAFEFAPLGSERFAQMFGNGGELPDSIVVQTADGRTLVRSDAIVHLQHRLGGLWRVIGFVLGLIPRVLRDAAYNFVARVRYRIFGRTKDACPLMPPDLRSRFGVR